MKPRVRWRFTGDGWRFVVVNGSDSAPVYFLPADQGDVREDEIFAFIFGVVVSA